MEFLTTSVSFLLIAGLIASLDSILIIGLLNRLRNKNNTEAAKVS